MNPGQQQGVSSVQGCGLLIFGCDCFAYCHEVIWRIPRTMGSEYPGWRVRIGAACAFPLFMIFSPPHHGAWLLVPWWYLLTGLIVLHLFLGWKSEAAHSYYIGDSLAWRWNKNWQTQGKRILPEFWLSMGLACLLAFLCDTVGKFVAFSGICSTVSLLLMRFRDQKIAQRMRNQQLDAEYYGQMFQNPRGDRP